MHNNNMPKVTGSDNRVNDTILYFRTNWKESIGFDMDRINDALGCNTIWCESWKELSNSLSAAPELILIHMDVIQSNKITIPEFINMISALTKCSNGTVARIGVIIEKYCTLSFIKELQSTEVAGIIPGRQSFGPDACIIAINTLRTKGIYWPKALINEFTSTTSNTTKQSTTIKLTVRQGQVASLICNRGLSNKNIANMLKISESTVKIHTSAVLKAYGVRNRTQLALAINSALKP